MTERPGTVAEVVEAGLPEDRDYATTVARPEFARATRRIRGLLGTASEAD
jgi:NitT/TauT family transport system ATP-binding protein